MLQHVALHRGDTPGPETHVLTTAGPKPTGTMGGPQGESPYRRVHPDFCPETASPALTSTPDQAPLSILSQGRRTRRLQPEEALRGWVEGTPTPLHQLEKK